jgi:hypothetical protein
MPHQVNFANGTLTFDPTNSKVSFVASENVEQPKSENDRLNSRLMQLELPNYVSWNENQAHCDIVMNFMLQLFGSSEKVHEFLLSIANIVFREHQQPPICLWMDGPVMSGKTTLSDLLHLTLGDRHISRVPMSYIGKPISNFCEGYSLVHPKETHCAIGLADPAKKRDVNDHSECVRFIRGNDIMRPRRREKFVEPIFHRIHLDHAIQISREEHRELMNSADGFLSLIVKSLEE